MNRAPRDEAMGPTAPARLIAAWSRDDGRPPHIRLAALLAALEPGAPLSTDTLGGRNRRLLQLHRDLVGRPLEARVTCGNCGVESEFTVPADAILELPVPDPAARVTVRLGHHRVTFRVPLMADLEAVGEVAGPREVRTELLTRCRLGDAPGDTEMPELVAHRLAARFEALDPAANIEVGIACSGCGQALMVSMDPATFVARDLDRLVEELFLDVDTIAAAYGWAELVILNLPSTRRRRYVELIRAARAPMRAVVGAAAR